MQTQPGGGEASSVPNIVVKKRWDWQHILSVIVLAFAILCHITSPLVLSSESGVFVQIYLFVVVCSLLALALAKKRLVVLLAFFVGFAGYVAGDRANDRSLAATRLLRWHVQEMGVDPSVHESEQVTQIRKELDWLEGASRAIEEGETPRPDPKFSGSTASMPSTRSSN
jgi:hypothetical protein